MLSTLGHNEPVAPDAPNSDVSSSDAATALRGTRDIAAAIIEDHVGEMSENAAQSVQVTFNVAGVQILVGDNFAAAADLAEAVGGFTTEPEDWSGGNAVMHLWRGDVTGYPVTITAVSSPAWERQP